MNKYFRFFAILACACLLTACGRGDGSTGSVEPLTTPPLMNASLSLQVTTSKGNLDSAAVVDSNITVFVLVKDANSNVVPNVPVSLFASSGVLTVGSRITDAAGMVNEKLSTGGDPTNRLITVTVRVAHVPDTQIIVPVYGTKIRISSNNTVTVGAATPIKVSLVDSTGAALADRAIAYGSLHGGLAVKDGNPAITDYNGMLDLVYSALPGNSSDTITVSALGANTFDPIIIYNSNITVTPDRVLKAGMLRREAFIGECVKVNIHHDIGSVATTGEVSLNTTRGTVYSDNACTTTLSNLFSLNISGDATAYVKSTAPGIATLVGTSLAPKDSGQAVLEFLAPLTSIATVTLQANQGVIATNSTSSMDRQTTLRAVVRDGSPSNNPVKDAIVNFSIVTDTSGGSLSQPSVVTTNSDGTATVNYLAGPSTTATNGVIIKAQIKSSITTASTTAAVTVVKRALFISASPENTVASTNPQSYITRYLVFVTDAAGNPVSGVKVTASIIPSDYYKGFLSFKDGIWSRTAASISCLNEDKNYNGILDIGEDDNGNGRLDPGIPVTVTSSEQTNASGVASVAVEYERNYAQWVEVDFRIKAVATGSEAVYFAHFVLVGAAADYNETDVIPPGRFSPYGTESTCASSN